MKDDQKLIDAAYTRLASKGLLEAGRDLYQAEISKDEHSSWWVNFRCPIIIVLPGESIYQSVGIRMHNDGEVDSEYWSPVGNQNAETSVFMHMTAEKETIKNDVDRVLKAKGNLAGYGDLSVGLEALTQSFDIVIQATNNGYDIDIHPHDHHNHDYHLFYNLETEELDGMIGHLVPPPDDEPDL